MRKSFKDSLKALEADIDHANTLYVYSSLCFFFFLLPFIFSTKIFTVPWDLVVDIF